MSWRRSLRTLTKTKALTMDLTMMKTSSIPGAGMVTSHHYLVAITTAASVAITQRGLQLRV
jgi:hypothetical protein